MQPLEHIKVAILGSITTNQHTPRARRVLVTQPLEHIQVTPFSSILTSPLIPRARRILAAHPLEHIQVTFPGSGTTSLLIPRTRRILAPQPLEHIQVTILGSIATSPLIPRAGRITLSCRCRTSSRCWRLICRSLIVCISRRKESSRWCCGWHRWLWWRRVPRLSRWSLSLRRGLILLRTAAQSGHLGEVANEIDLLLLAHQAGPVLDDRLESISSQLRFGLSLLELERLLLRSPQVLTLDIVELGLRNEARVEGLFDLLQIA